VGLIVGCYSPSLKTGIPCTSTFDCPGDQVCDRSLPEPTCVEEVEGTPDGGIEIINDAIDGSIEPDGPPARSIPPGAVLWLQMEDDPADGAIDSAGTHAVACTSACPSIVAGKYGSAYRFSGDHRLETPDAPELRPGSAFSAAAWVKLDAQPSEAFGALACKVIDSTDASFCLSVRTNGKPTYYTAGNNTAEGAASVTVGTWHHLAVTWDGATKRGYLDGTPYAIQAIAAIAATTGPFAIGAFQLTTFRVPGAIDDVVYYTRALTPNEVAQLAAP
jgi:hypothetical protein